MGIRVHVMMGYGLVDIQTNDEGNITDPRINPNGYLMVDAEKQEQFTIEEFTHHIREKIDQYRCTDFVLYTACAEERLEVYECIRHDAEFGLPNVLCIIPPAHTSWIRYDDILDYTLASLGVFPVPIDNPCEPWVKVSHFPFYPHLGWDDSLTEEPVIGKKDGIIRECAQRVWTRPSSNLYGDENAVICSEWQDILECVTTGEVFKRYVPSIPGTIKEMVKYTKLFIDDRIVYQLRPLVYCYWG